MEHAPGCDVSCTSDMEPSAGLCAVVAQVQHVLDEKKLLLEVRHPFIVTLCVSKAAYRLL